MKIKNWKEYIAALERASVLLDQGFEGSIAREKYFRELVKAIVDFETENGELPLPKSVQQNPKDDS